MALDYLPSPGWAVIYGETPSATRWSELGDNDDALATGAGIDDLAIINRHIANQIIDTNKMNASTVYRAHVRPTSDRNIANASAVPYPNVTFDTAEYNVGTLWSAGAPTRLTAPVKGLYMVHGTIGLAGNPTGRRGIDYYVNGSPLTLGNELTPLIAATLAQNLALESTNILQLNANDYVTMGVYQDSGGNLLLQANRTHMVMVLLCRIP